MCGQIFDIMFTSHDIVTSIQLSTNCNLAVCISESRHDTKNLTAIEDPKDKIRSNFFKRCRRRYIFSEDYSVATDFPKGFAKILLGTPMDRILNFLERADRELSENVYFYSPL